MSSQELEIRQHTTLHSIPTTTKMPPRAIIPAAIVTAPTPERQNFVHSSYPHDHPQGRQAGPSRVSYGSTQSARTSPGSHKGKEPAVDFDERCDVESCDSDDGDDMEPLVDSESSLHLHGIRPKPQ